MIFIDLSPLENRLLEMKKLKLKNFFSLELG